VGARFSGWPAEAQAVLLQLDGEPSRQTRDQLRRQREKQVRLPMIDLLNDLADADPWYEDFSVWRYGTIAFWWQHQCAVVRVARNVEFGFQFSLDGLLVKLSWWYGDAQQIALFRAAVAADQSGCALEGLVESLTADGHEISGDMLKRVPRGYPAEHPRADLLRYRSLSVRCELDSEAVRDVKPVYRACERLRPLAGWLGEHLAG
jgi:Conserved hypothetical protein (DUF2461)